MFKYCPYGRLFMLPALDQCLWNGWDFRVLWRLAAGFVLDIFPRSFVTNDFCHGVLSDKL